MSNSGISAILLISVSFLLIAAAAGVTLEVTTDISDDFRSSGESLENSVSQNFHLTTQSENIFDKTRNEIQFSVRNNGQRNFDIDSIDIQLLINGEPVDFDINTQSEDSQWNRQSSAKFTVEDTSNLRDKSDNSLVLLIESREIESRFFVNLSNEIEDWNDVDNVLRDNPSENFILVNSLDEETEGYEDVVQGGFEPIDTSFTGNFYGQRNSISDIEEISENLEGESRVGGLFNEISEGVVKNLVLKNIEISFDSDQGTQYGLLSGAVINNATIRNIHIGRDGTQNPILDVEDVSIVGGMTGYNSGNIIQSSVQGSSIDGDTEVGGLVGENSGKIKDSYTKSTVYGSDNIGGLVGSDTSNKDISVKNSYVSTDVSDLSGEENSNIGFIAGQVDSSEGLSLYFNEDINGDATEAVGSGTYDDTTRLSESEMVGESASDNMVDLNFVVVWDTIINNDDFPVLQGLEEERQLNLRG